MRAFRNIPFRSKLRVTIFSIVALALVILGTGILIVDNRLFRQSLNRDLASVADMTADNTNAAVAFDDAKSAAETLAALKAKPHMVAACVYKSNGSQLARYLRPGGAVGCAGPISDASDDGPNVVVRRAILLQGQRVGTVVLVYDLEEVLDRRKLYAAILALMIVFSGGLALLLSWRLQKVILTPIAILTEAAQAVSKTKDYGLRVEKVSGDELGFLSDAFNEMLYHIQTRDAELLTAREELEQRVLDRTAELRLSEERFRLSIEGVQGYAIFMLDPEGRVSSWNKGAQKIKQYAPEEIIGQHFSRFYPPEALEAGRLERNLQVAAIEGRFEDEGWRIRKDGSRFWAGVLITALRDPAGKLIGFSKITRDLTERKRAEEALRERAEELARSNADLQQFAYVASHDLQEPLRMVISYLQILADRYRGKLDADADEFIGYAVDGGYRMRQLITDLLEYSRVGTRRQEPAPADCQAILEDVRLNLELAIREGEAEITCDPDPLPTILADPTHMLQLFQNLVSNAIKFRGPRPARIRISAQFDDGFWLFSIADQGIGIDPEHKEAIFEIFRRLHDRMEYPGTGIGLAVCKKIVDRLGGRIWVESEPGRGATFHFSIANPKPGQKT